MLYLRKRLWRSESKKNRSSKFFKFVNARLKNAKTTPFLNDNNAMGLLFMIMLKRQISLMITLLQFSQKMTGYYQILKPDWKWIWKMLFFWRNGFSCSEKYEKLIFQWLCSLFLKNSVFPYANHCLVFLNFLSTSEKFLSCGKRLVYLCTKKETWVKLKTLDLFHFALFRANLWKVL